MASSILLRTYSSVDDKRIVLKNSHFSRLHGVNSSWNAIRVALRVSITDFGSNLGSTPEFVVGLCSGTTNVYKDSTTTHFVGMQTSGTTWTRQTNLGVPTYTTGASSIRPMKRVGTTTTTGTSGGNGFN